MGHDHVAERAALLVEPRAALDRERLGHVDLDVAHVVAIPDRLEEAVREAKREDVVDRLLAQEVVDSEDLRLLEVLGDDGVEGLGRADVVPERLLADHPGVLVQLGLAEHLDHRGECGGRNREVVEPTRAPADLLVGQLDGCHEPTCVPGLGEPEAESLGELVPLLALGGGAAELRHCVLGVIAERLVRHREGLR